MRRIKLSRPPPVSSETVSDNAVVDSRSKKTHDTPTENQAGDVSAVNTSTDTSGDRLITRKDDVAVKEDTRRVKHKRSITQNVHEHSIAASVNVLQSLTSVPVDSDVLPVREPARKSEYCSISQAGAAVQTSVPVGEYTRSSYDEQHIVVDADNIVSGSATVKDHFSKKLKKTVFDKGRSGHAEATFLGPDYDIHELSKQNSDRSFHGKSDSVPPSQETVTHAQHQQSKLETDSKLSGSLLLNEALKGFLVQKLAAIENERKGTEDVSVKEVPQNESEDFYPSSKWKRHKYPRKNSEQQRNLEYLPATSRDRDKKLAVSESERKGTDTNHEDVSTEDIVKKKLKDFSLSSELRRSKHSRKNSELQKDFRYFPVKSRDRDQTFHHHADEFRETHYMADYTGTPLADWPHGHHRLPPRAVHGFSGAEDKTMDSLDAEVNSYGRGHRKHMHNVRHSLHMRKNLVHSEDRTRQKEDGHQSCDFLKHEGNQYHEQRSYDGTEQEHQRESYDLLQCEGSKYRQQTRRSFDCIVPVRQFVSQTAVQFSHSISQDHAPVEHYLKNCDLKPFISERQKSGSSHRHHSHHHIKKRKNLKQISADVEQVQQVVSRTPIQFSHPVNRDHVPVEHYVENSDTKTLSRERQKSGSSHGHHCRHHHVKKQKSLKHTLADETSASRHKCVKHGTGRKSVRNTKSKLQDMSRDKKRRKHRHKHHHSHSKSILEDAQLDHEKLDKSETELKAEDDSFIKGRSLSPLGLHRKHSQKHKRKKSSEKTVSETLAQNVPLPDKMDTQYDQISEDEDFIPMKIQKNDGDGDVAFKVQHKMDVMNATDVKQGQSSSKSAVKPKFLKISGKRPRRRTLISDTTPSAEAQMPSEHDGSGGVSAEEHSVQNTVSDESQVLKDATTDLKTSESEDTLTPVVAAEKVSIDQVGITGEVSVLVGFIVSQPANSCTDTDDRGVLQAKTAADQVSQSEVSSEMQILSGDEVSKALEKSAAAAVTTDSMLESFRADKTHQLGVKEQQDIMEETDDVTKELSTQEKIVSCANGADLKVHTTDEAYDSNCSETTEEYDVYEYDTDVDLHGASTVVQDKNTEKAKSQELLAVLQEVPNVTCQHTVSDNSVIPAITAPLQLNISKETVPAADVSSGELASREGSSMMKTKNMTESICDIDDEVCENFPPVSGRLMGPPVGLPPVATFKKPLPAIKLNVRISDASADFISSGTKKVQLTRRVRTEENREEGNYVVSVADCLTCYWRDMYVRLLHMYWLIAG